MITTEKRFEADIESFFLSPAGGYTKGADTYDAKQGLYVNMLMCGLKENKVYCKPIIKHCNRKQPLQEKKQGKKHRRKRKRKAAKWSYNGNIFL